MAKFRQSEVEAKEKLLHLESVRGDISFLHDSIEVETQRIIDLKRSLEQAQEELCQVIGSNEVGHISLAAIEALLSEVDQEVANLKVKLGEKSKELADLWQLCFQKASEFSGQIVGSLGQELRLAKRNELMEEKKRLTDQIHEVQAKIQSLEELGQSRAQVEKSISSAKTLRQLMQDKVEHLSRTMEKTLVQLAEAKSKRNEIRDKPDREIAELERNIARARHGKNPQKENNDPLPTNFVAASSLLNSKFHFMPYNRR